MKRANFLIINLLFALSASAQHGIDPHWSTSTPVAKSNPNASASGAVANNMVVTNNGTVIIFYKENNANYYVGSSDNGTTWNAPAPTLFAPSAKTGGNSTISADLDLAGNIHTIWSARTPSGLFYSRWDAATQTWSDTVRISKSVRYRITYSQLTTDRKNRLHACWMDGEVQSRSYSEVMYARSLDGGRTWSAPVRLSKDDNMHSAFPMPDFSGATSDTLGIAWRDSVSSSNWDIMMAYTLDAGASWSQPLLVSGGSGIQSDPSLIVDKNGVFHLAHHEYPQGGGPQSANVKYGYSTNHGLSWTFKQLSTANVRSHLVKEAYDYVNDVVWIFWKDERDFVSPFDRRADIIGAAITNRGATIGAPEFLSDGGSLEYGFHNFKVGPDASVRAHFNTFYSDGMPSTIYYTERRSLSTGVSEAPSAMPQKFVLAQNYPNPFNPATVIRFQLPANSHVTLKVFDVNGREVARLIDGEMNAGNHSVRFAPQDFAGGLYFYQLTAGKFSQTRKAILMK
ncbi:MAG: exo-alpha-sialidase [candidate division KSB1 bacterium]|nr:exo-alpha-sialidase [candidate division KSB1 bacterium]MDZ7303681.1 exo-alpha-sialidase [candidate division KSB1 bacterium]